MSRHQEEFQAIHSQGGLLPPDLMRRLRNDKEKLIGTRQADYQLAGGERLNEVITASWTRLCTLWNSFQKDRADAGEGALTGLTNQKWTLPLLQELGFGHLPIASGPVIDDVDYPIERFYGRTNLAHTPIHLVGCGVDLDKRATGVRGAARTSPHGMVQDYLNRDDKSLWAILANGLRLRLLRDNSALSRQSYLEFDLESMFDGQIYADFVTFWLLCHATRFLPEAGKGPDSSWLEKWTHLANEEGARALDALQSGVEKALQALGRGFVSHPGNDRLRDLLRSGELSRRELHNQLLRIVYRLIFLFVAEDRSLEGTSLLHSPPPERDDKDAREAHRRARKHYTDHYSTRRLRHMAQRIRGSRHGDLWQQFSLIVNALSGEEPFTNIRNALALPALGSMLWDPESTWAFLASPAVTGAENSGDAPRGNPLKPCSLSNSDFLEAIRHLAFFEQDRIQRPVDYRNLGTEELGSVYESLLALTPQISDNFNHFTFAEFSGNKRKSTGSYYTPRVLVQSLLDTALEPLVKDRLDEARRLAKKDRLSPDEALPPWFDDALKKADAALPLPYALLAESALLSLRICDPACGSGHFLIGAAHRLAAHLARLRALSHGESEASPGRYQQALREVIGSCLYGVDINPMAVELCKVSLWLEALEAGKPLSFLDHHIQCGNSLVGATPERIETGIPDGAFNPLTGDEKPYATRYKKQNRDERDRKQTYLEQAFSWQKFGNLSASMAKFRFNPDDSLEEIRRKEKDYADLIRSSDYLSGRLLADSWCAAFFWPKKENRALPFPITEGSLRRIEANPHWTPQWMQEEIQRLTTDYQFFHWHLAFPEVFPPAPDQSTPQGGFDLMLGNPPWERIKLQEQEWFAERDPVIAKASNAAARKEMIQALKTTDPAFHGDFQKALHQAEGQSLFLRHSGMYPLCGRGDVNLYSVFAELNRRLLSAQGRVGIIVPSGIASDDTTKFFFQDLLENNALASLYDFENREKLFPIDSRIKFCLLSLRAAREDEGSVPADLAFFLHHPRQLSEEERHIALSGEDITRLNPNTRTCPVFRSRADGILTKALYRRAPILIREAQDKQPEENPWDIKFVCMFHMSNDSHLFHTRKELIDEGCTLKGNIFHAVESEQERFLPLYEGKMIHHYDHRWNTFEERKERDSTLEEKQNPDFHAQPRYWMAEPKVAEVLERRDWKRPWLLGFRDVTNNTNERTMITSPFPQSAVGHTCPLIFSSKYSFQVILFSMLCSSFSFDYNARQKLGGTHLTYLYFKQLPVLPPEAFDAPCPWSGDSSSQSVADFLLPRILELSYTAWDMQPFAKDLGWEGPPFRWDEERRFQIRVEVDAAFFHLYLRPDKEGQWQLARKEEGAPYDEREEELAELKNAFPTPRDAVEHMMDTFPIVRKNDEKTWNRYRTKDTILEIYDAYQTARQITRAYETPLDPPPGVNRG